MVFEYHGTAGVSYAFFLALGCEHPKSALTRQYASALDCLFYNSSLNYSHVYAASRSNPAFKEYYNIEVNECKTKTNFPLSSPY